MFSDYFSDKTAQSEALQTDYRNAMIRNFHFPSESRMNEDLCIVAVLALLTWELFTYPKFSLFSICTLPKETMVTMDTQC